MEKMAKLRTTPQFRTFWEFAVERQNIFFKRLRGEDAPWTADPILQTYKFVNVYRASDRVSQYLIRNVIRPADSVTDTIFRVVLFKIFNRISTWETLSDEFEELIWSNYSFKDYYTFLSVVMKERKQPIFNSAYMLPGQRSKQLLGTHYARKHGVYLRVLEKMLRDVDIVTGAESLEQLYNILISYPYVGRFLAYQWAIDLNYTDIFNFSENDYVVPGPGCIRGMDKCFKAIHTTQYVPALISIQEHQNEWMDRFGLLEEWKNLFGRQLHLVDVQSLFCEVDKYTRVSNPTGNNYRRKRPKSKFKAHSEPIAYIYPPKWDINAEVAKFVR